MSLSNQSNVKVGEFRQRYEHLYRKLSDYHACCSADEVRNWKRVTQALLEAVSALTCTRASNEDLRAQQHAIDAITERLAVADKRIEVYAMKSVAKAALQQSTRPVLRLIQGGKASLMNHALR